MPKPNVHLDHQLLLNTSNVALIGYTIYHVYMDGISERPAPHDISVLPKNVETSIKETILEVSQANPKELLLDSFSEALEHRQKMWIEQQISPEEILNEIRELKSMTLSPSLRGVDFKDLSLPILFTDYQVEKAVPLMQRKLLEIYGKSPELAREIVDKSIVGAHGTRSGSLINILSHGLRPTDYQKENKLSSLAGTFDWGGDSFNRKSTSQCLWWNDREIAGYTKRPAVNITNLEGWMDSYRKEWDQPDMSPTRKMILGKAKEMNDFLQKQDKIDVEKDIETCLRADFPVIILVDKLTLSKDNLHTVESDVQSEFAIDEGLPAESIPTILVPSKDVELVTKLAKKYSWHGIVRPIENYVDSVS